MLAGRALDGSALREWVSTDDAPRLAYSTPRGSVFSYRDSRQQNLAFLRSLSPKRDTTEP